MEFEKMLDGGVETSKIKDVGEDRALYESKFWGGSIRWYGDRGLEIVGRRKNVLVRARCYAPGKVAITFEASHA